jgi:SAM-dependent methyltransferase
MAKGVAGNREDRATSSRLGGDHVKAGRRNDTSAGALNSARIGLYEDPAIYDILHEPGTPSEVRTLVRIWKRVSGSSPRVALEPACGTGRYLARLLRAGWGVRGFDSDPAMVKFSRAKLRKGDAKVWQCRFDTFGSKVAVGSIGLAFCPINSIRHVASDAEMVRHLKLITRVLAPSGVYAVGISLSAYGLEAPTEDVWTGARRSVRIKQVVSFTPADGGSKPRQRSERVDSVLEIQRGDRTEIRSSTYSLFSYSREQWETVIDRSGLRVIGMVNEFATKFDPGRIGYAIWLLARPDHPLASRHGITGLRRSG